MNTRCKGPDTGEDAESFVLEGEEMWAMRVIDEHQSSKDSSDSQADVSSEGAE
jgi:hypothetical protein